MHLVSKVLGAFTQPLFLVALILLFGWARRETKAARWCCGSALLLLALLGIQVVPDAMIRALELQYPTMEVERDWSRFAGIVVLGGGLEDGYVSELHAQPLINDAGERLVMATVLARRTPSLRVLFTGGEGRLLGTGPKESERARLFFENMELSGARMLFEAEARNTYENAIYSALLPGVDPKMPWLLVTSAWHMPRAMATFVKAGWNVTAFPVDYRTGTYTSVNTYDLTKSLTHWDLALHEWVGLWAYRLLGRA